MGSVLHHSDVSVLWTPYSSDGCSLCRNVLKGLEAARGEWLWILEDDEWYSPRYFSAVLAAMQVPGAKVVGNHQWLIYHVPSRRYEYLRHDRDHTNLCQAVLHKDVWQFLRRAAMVGTPSIDLALWSLLRKYEIPVAWLDDPTLMVGLKGLGGEAGYSLHHSADTLKFDDPHALVLRSVLGHDADHYLE